MSETFCNEPIIACYRGCGECDDIGGSDEWFDVYYDIAYHVTAGYRIILETEHFYISLSHGGVTKAEKNCTVKEFLQDGECLESLIHEVKGSEQPWIEYEYTLFVGERLLDVQSFEDHYVITFDDFEMKLIPHRLHDNDFPGLRSSDPWSYHRVLGSERFLTGKCNCGGEGELLLDFVSDYVVRCRRCKHSTYAKMIAIEAIEEWKAGRIQCDASDIAIE